MSTKQNYRAVSWLIVASIACAAFLAAANQEWIGKQPAQWTEEDAQQFLASSPWSQEVGAGIARRLSEAELKEGGQMGQPQTVGNAGVDPKGSGYPISPDMLKVFTGRGGDDRSPRSLAHTMKVRLCWESALPVRLAELKAHIIEPPTLDGDGYQIAVYGVPGEGFKEDPKQLGDPLKKTAALKREGKPDVKPARVEVFQRSDGLVVVYLFPFSAELSRKDAQVRFEAQIGRISVAHTYNLKDMEFQGRLEL